MTFLHRLCARILSKHSHTTRKRSVAEKRMEIVDQIRAAKNLPAWEWKR